MRKNKLNFKFKVKIKEQKMFQGIISILFIFFTILSFLSIKQPLQYQQKIASNNITQKINIDYSTEDLPDGMNSIDGTIFSKIQNNLDVHIISTINSEKPVSIAGEGTIYYDIISEGLWTYSLPISEKMNLDLSGSENTLIDSHFQINLDEVENIINQTISQITGTSGGRYILRIRPDLQGNILYENKTIPLDNTYTLSFDYSNGLLKKLDGEIGEFNSDIPVENLIVRNNEFKFLGISLPLMLSRYMFSIVALVLLIIILLNVKNFKSTQRKGIQTSRYIDKKFENRIIHLHQEPKLLNKTLLSLSNFKDLIRIADEKDLSILKYYKTNSDIAIYTVIDGECIFIYSINSIEVDENNNLDIFTLGSDVFNG